VPEPGRYAPVAYQVAIGTFLSCQVLALLWFFANRRRLAAAETQTI
jgi:hypothetical protein